MTIYGVQSHRRHPCPLITFGPAAATAVVATLALAAPAAAHPHQVAVAHHDAGQVIANGQDHAPFINGQSCGGDPAAYALETAHHGPDAATPGRTDDCYTTTDAVVPALDVSSPVIR